MLLWNKRFQYHCSQQQTYQCRSTPFRDIYKPTPRSRPQNDISTQWQLRQTAQKQERARPNQKKSVWKKRQVNRKIHHGFYIRDLFANGGRQPQINRNESSWCETKKRKWTETWQDQQRVKLGLECYFFNLLKKLRTEGLVVAT